MQFSQNTANNSNNIYATGIGVPDNNNNNNTGNSDSVINGAFVHPVNDQQQMNLQPNAKNIGHYIYAADQPNADSLLKLDLPPNTSISQNHHLKRNSDNVRTKMVSSASD